MMHEGIQGVFRTFESHSSSNKLKVGHFPSRRIQRVTCRGHMTSETKVLRPPWALFGALTAHPQKSPSESCMVSLATVLQRGGTLLLTKYQLASRP
jgi:hypothetical protein